MKENKEKKEQGVSVVFFFWCLCAQEKRSLVFAGREARTRTGPLILGIPGKER
jgi:hypothetical protein